MTDTPEHTYPPPMPYAVQTSTMAIISLISGIAAWLGFFGIGGILAVVLGHMAKGEIRKSGGLITGDGIATAGLVLGYANIALTVVGFCFFLLFFLGIFTTPLLCLPFMNEINTSFTTIP